MAFSFFGLFKKRRSVNEINAELQRLLEQRDKVRDGDYYLIPGRDKALTLIAFEKKLSKKIANLEAEIKKAYVEGSEELKDRHRELKRHYTGQDE